MVPREQPAKTFVGVGILIGISIGFIIGLIIKNIGSAVVVCAFLGGIIGSQFIRE